MDNSLQIEIFVVYREPRNRSQRLAAPSLLCSVLSGDRTVMFQASAPSTKSRYERLLLPLSGTFSMVIAPNFEYPLLMYLRFWLVGDRCPV